MEAFIELWNRMFWKIIQLIMAVPLSLIVVLLLNERPCSYSKRVDETFMVYVVRLCACTKSYALYEESPVSHSRYTGRLDLVSSWSELAELGGTEADWRHCFGSGCL